ncbi:MAG TPA: glycosyltransferase [Candidatus Paceibacterota bacterium]|nr:glycosyltransferase [Candidatus Paceibacterota bacterium]
MKVLSIGADRSKRGILFQDSPAASRQRAYAERFGQLDIIGFSRRGEAKEYSEPHLHVYPTNSASRLLYGLDAIRIAKKLPRPDVVSSQDPFETGLAAWRIARHFNVPLYVQVHTDFLSPTYARLSVTNRLRVLLAGFVLKRAARVRVVSERIKHLLQNTRHKIQAPITALPIFADVARFKDLEPSAELAAKFEAFKTKVLVVARLEPEKNIELAVRAFAEAAPKDACLIVVGRGSMSGRLQALAHALRVADRVFFEGEKEGTPYYKLANLVLVPSRYEGYGLTIVDALAAGVPVLSTDVGVAKDAGAIISSEENFARDLQQWFEHGPRAGVLRGYPYHDFGDYAAQVAADIAAAAH